MSVTGTVYNILNKGQNDGYVEEYCEEYFEERSCHS